MPSVIEEHHQIALGVMPKTERRTKYREREKNWIFMHLTADHPQVEKGKRRNPSRMIKGRPRDSLRTRHASKEEEASGKGNGQENTRYLRCPCL